MVNACTAFACRQSLPGCHSSSLAFFTQGHTDWVFGMAWLTEKHLATCSKDHTIALWSVDAEGEHTTKTPLQTITDHKVRHSVIIIITIMS